MATTVTTLATYAEVAARLGLSGTTGQTEIDDILEGITAAFDNYCGRQFMYEADKTEYLTGNGGEVVAVKCWPIIEVDSIKIAYDRDFTNGTSLTEDDDFTQDPDTGLLFYRFGSWPENRRSIKVVYTGGYTHATTDPQPDPAEAEPFDLREAAIQQAIAWYQRRKTYHMKGESNPVGNVAYLETGELLPAVQAILDGKYRRWAV